jgi:hypothetical protein
MTGAERKLLKSEKCHKLLHFLRVGYVNVLFYRFGEKILIPLKASEYLT